MAKIVIIGGGFGGVETARYLRKFSGNGALEGEEIDITVISERDFLFLYPAAIWVPTGKAKVDELKLPLESISKKYKLKLVKDGITGFNIAENKIIGANGDYGYDYLVIASGSEKLKKVKGLENTVSICGGPDEIADIGQRYASLLDRGEGSISFGFSGNPADESAMRGGPVFEIMLNIEHDLRSRGLRDSFDINFFAPSKDAGKKLGPAAMEKVRKLLESHGIKLNLGLKIEEFQERAVIFEDGSRLDSDLTVFVPGIAGNSRLKDSGLPLNDGGFVRVDMTAGVEGYDNIYAVGDTASHDGPSWRAKQGHHAQNMAKAAAFNIIGGIKGVKKRRSFPIELLCVMDRGDGRAFFIYRHKDKSYIFGGRMMYALKRLWKFYYVMSRL